MKPRRLPSLLFLLPLLATIRRNRAASASAEQQQQEYKACGEEKLRVKQRCCSRSAVCLGLYREDARCTFSVSLSLSPMHTLAHNNFLREIFMYVMVMNRNAKEEEDGSKRRQSMGVREKSSGKKKGTDRQTHKQEEG